MIGKSVALALLAMGTVAGAATHFTFTGSAVVTSTYNDYPPVGTTLSVAGGVDLYEDIASDFTGGIVLFNDYDPDNTVDNGTWFWTIGDGINSGNSDDNIFKAGDAFFDEGQITGVFLQNFDQNGAHRLTSSYFTADTYDFGDDGTFEGDVMLDQPVEAIPEPAAWAMMVAGFGLIGVMRRRGAGDGRGHYAA